MGEVIFCLIEPKVPTAASVETKAHTKLRKTFGDEEQAKRKAIHRPENFLYFALVLNGLKL